MKNKKLILSLFLLIFLVISQVGSVIANSLGDTPPTINEDKVVIGQSFTLRENQILNGDLAIIGGTATLKSGSQVTGDVAVIGGVLEIDGRVTGNVQAFGGSITLNQSAIIEGSLYNFGSNLRQSDGARIEGSQVSNLPFDFNFGAVEIPDAKIIPFEAAKRTTGFVTSFLWAVLQIIAMGGLAMLVVLIAPKSTDRIATSIGKQPLTHWGIGLLTAFAFPAVILVCIITIILIPLGLIGIMALTVAIIYGWIALGYEIGKRLFVNNTNMSPALIAGIGTVILSIVSRVVGAIPCIGWLLVVTLGLFGLGAIILTRAGTRDYPEPVRYPSSGSIVQPTKIVAEPIESDSKDMNSIGDVDDQENL